MPSRRLLQCGISDFINDKPRKIDPKQNNGRWSETSTLVIISEGWSGPITHIMWHRHDRLLPEMYVPCTALRRGVLRTTTQETIFAMAWVYQKHATNFSNDGIECKPALRLVDDGIALLNRI